MVFMAPRSQNSPTMDVLANKPILPDCSFKSNHRPFFESPRCALLLHGGMKALELPILFVEGYIRIVAQICFC